MNTAHILHNYSTYFFLSKHFETNEDSSNIQSGKPVPEGECMVLVKGANSSMQSLQLFFFTNKYRYFILSRMNSIQLALIKFQS